MPYTREYYVKYTKKDGTISKYGPYYGEVKSRREGQKVIQDYIRYVPKGSAKAKKEEKEKWWREQEGTDVWALEHKVQSEREIYSSIDRVSQTKQGYQGTDSVTVPIDKFKKDMGVSPNTQADRELNRKLLDMQNERKLQLMVAANPHTLSDEQKAAAIKNHPYPDQPGYTAYYMYIIKRK